MQNNKNASVLILGAGPWGLSTAYHLTQAGYSDITVLERAETIPSKYSAAYDLNKIVRAEYEDPFYTGLALEAMEGWKKRDFGPYFHQTGCIVATTEQAPEKARMHLKKALASVSQHPRFADQIIRLETSSAFHDIVWQFSGSLDAFKGYFNRLAGYAHATDALYGTWKICASKGVKFLTGNSGRVTELLYDHLGRKCTGARTADGKSHYAQTTICALGAWTSSLIPSLGHTVTARCWSVAHVQLSKEESDYLRGIPVTNVHDLGFFFEPDPETRLFKLCPFGAGYTNTSEDGISLPPAPEKGEIPAPENFIPAEDERKLRRLLWETFPWMSNRPFVDKKLCWFADTSDSNYIIDFVPRTSKSLVVLSGDSGHGFKMMPIFGNWVVALLSRGTQSESRWQWRTHRSRKDFGDSVSWRVGQGKEISGLIEQKRRLEQYEEARLELISRDDPSSDSTAEAISPSDEHIAHDIQKPIVKKHSDDLLEAQMKTMS